MNKNSVLTKSILISLVAGMQVTIGILQEKNARLVERNNKLKRRRDFYYEKLQRLSKKRKKE